MVYVQAIQYICCKLKVLFVHSSLSLGFLFYVYSRSK